VGAVNCGKQVILTMPNADINNLVAHFVVNPFVAPIGQGTVFAGVLTPADVANTQIASVGYVTGTLTSAGSFSGQIVNSGKTDRFSATFYGNCQALFNLTPATTSTLNLSDGRTLELGFDAANGTIIATLTQAGKISRATLQRAAYSATNKVSSSLLNRKTRADLTANNQGYFTAALPAIDQTPSMASRMYPQGSGYAMITLLETGTVSVTGVLADGTSFTSSTLLVVSDAAPMFAQLKTPGATSLLGSLGGRLDFAVATHSDVSSRGLVWIRPEVTQTTGTTATAVATQLYTSGWPTGISVGFAGALYDSASMVATQLTLSAPDATKGNAELQFYDGKLVTPVCVRNFNVAANTVTKIPATDKTYTLSVSPTNGQFSGTFTPNWTQPSTKKPAFKGIVVTKGLTGPAGYGFFHSNRSADLDPESGEVTIGLQTP